MDQGTLETLSNIDLRYNYSSDGLREQIGWFKHSNRHLQWVTYHYKNQCNNPDGTSYDCKPVGIELTSDSGRL